MKHFGDIIPQERNPAAQEMRRPAEARPFKGAPSKLPSMQFFGPSDFVPELPHNVQVETPQAICILQGFDCFCKIADTCLVRVGW